MEIREEFQGFVPVSLHLPSQRIDGKAWKFANRRLLQQIEEDKRQFLPIIEAKVYAVDGESARPTGEFDVLAVNRSAVTAIEPKDTVASGSER